MRKHATLFILFASVTSTLLAAPQTFDFKDPKGVNNAEFKLDAPLEAISGNAPGISGTVLFDPEAPANLKGTLVVATASMHVPNPMMKEHLHSSQWMDVARFPEIRFETKRVQNVKTQGTTTTADVTGALTIRNITHEITVPVKLTYLKDKLGQRVPRMNGDLLVLRTNFQIKRSDYEINPAAPEDKVSNTIELSLSIAGASPQS